MLRAVIIDDEKLWLEMLSNLLSRYCPTVTVVASCNTAAEGISAIRQHQPDVVFTDIEMPEMNGFEMLKQFSKIDFDIIFITAYDKYAHRAFQCSALDYLMKPVNPGELKSAVKKVELKQMSKVGRDQLELFFSAFKSRMASVKKIALPSAESVVFVSPENIIRCESDSNYTLFIMENKQRILVSKTLKDIQDMLEHFGFLRIHHSHLINPNHIEKFIKGDGGYLLMKDGSHLTISRSHKDRFNEMFSKI